MFLQQKCCSLMVLLPDLAFSLSEVGASTALEQPDFS